MNPPPPSGYCAELFVHAIMSTKPKMTVLCSVRIGTIDYLSGSPVRSFKCGCTALFPDRFPSLTAAHSVFRHHRPMRLAHCIRRLQIHVEIEFPETTGYDPRSSARVRHNRRHNMVHPLSPLQWFDLMCLFSMIAAVTTILVRLGCARCMSGADDAYTQWLAQGDNSWVDVAVLMIGRSTCPLLCRQRTPC